MSASDLSQLAPPPSRALKGEDAPLPLRENNGFDAAAFDAALANGGDPMTALGGGGLCADAVSAASTPAQSNRDGANVVAALNFNAKRVPFSPFDEATDGKLGSVYTRVTETLLHRGDWDRRPALRNKATGELKLPGSYGLLLGTAQGKGVPWGRLGYGVWPPPLVNYCRGFDMLTRKGKMQATLEQGREQFEGSWPPGMPEELTKGPSLHDPADNVWELCPPSFVFHPSKGEANPREALREAYAQRAVSAAAKHAADPTAFPNGPADGNRWILKPSEGAKGEGIFIESTLEAIEAHLDKQEAKASEGEAVSSWVVQQYIHNPLLLERGGRKFDMRCWVLVDASYGIHLYRHGVLRVASAAYDPTDVNNRFAHLTNHCIATEHEEYGKYEPTNELFYAAFDDELRRRYPQHAARAKGVRLFGGDGEEGEGGAQAGPASEDVDEPEDCVSSYRAPSAASASATKGSRVAQEEDESGSVLESVVLPQIRRHIVQTMLAARERLESDGEYYRPFQLYGYDFLVDAELRVWLCEINASPAVADELLPALVDDLIRTAIDPFFAPNDDLLKEGRAAYDRAAKDAKAPSRRECFECLFKPEPKAEEAHY